MAVLWDALQGTALFGVDLRARRGTSGSGLGDGL